MRGEERRERRGEERRGEERGGKRREGSGGEERGRERRRGGEEEKSYRASSIIAQMLLAMQEAVQGNQAT